MSEASAQAPGVVIATAGHVDHGKSTLVEALTGTNPDRLAEEQRRGLTIELGFATTTLADGTQLTLVDVPGHERFIATALAGAGSADACMFVVDAREGWRAQSREHLAIIDLLGIAHGVVALTHAALVTSAELADAAAAVRARLAGTSMHGAAIVPVDAPAGVGLDALRLELARVVAATSRRRDRGRPRVWIDRSFAVRGHGLVVTGTLVDGSLSVGDELELHHVGRARSRHSLTTGLRVRSLQRFGLDVATSGPGHRVAVGLASTERCEPHRGDVLCMPRRWHPATAFDATLVVLASHPAPLKAKGAFTMHVGTAAIGVRLRLLAGTDAIGAGEEGLVRLLADRALPLLPGDRYILREAGRGVTVGGGEILEVDPFRRVGAARPDRSVRRVVAERGWILAAELERRTGEATPATLGAWVIDADRLAADIAEMWARVEAAGGPGIDPATLDARQRLLVEHLRSGGGEGRALRIVDGRVRVVAPHAATDDGSGRPSVGLDRHQERILLAFRASLLAPPKPEEAGATITELRALERRGLMVEADGVWFSASAIPVAARALSAALADGASLEVGTARELLGGSRRTLVPLLGLLDRNGVTRRIGSLRVAGARLAAVCASAEAG